MPRATIATTSATRYRVLNMMLPSKKKGEQFASPDGIAAGAQSAATLHACVNGATATCLRVSRVIACK